MAEELNKEGGSEKRNYVRYGNKSEKIQVTSLPQLRGEARIMDKEISQQAKQINRAINNASNFTLPKETLQRYNQQFSKKDEKKAFKTVFAIFLISLGILLLFQPSIFFTQTQGTLVLENFSQREIKNITIYSLESIMKNNGWPAKTINSLGPNQKIILDLEKENFYIAFADRQMPTIGLYTDPNKRLNNQQSNISTGNDPKTPKDLYDEMIGG